MIHRLVLSEVVHSVQGDRVRVGSPELQQYHCHQSNEMDVCDLMLCHCL